MFTGRTQILIFQKSMAKLKALLQHVRMDLFVRKTREKPKILETNGQCSLEQMKICFRSKQLNGGRIIMEIMRTQLLLSSHTRTNQVNTTWWPGHVKSEYYWNVAILSLTSVPSHHVHDMNC